MAVRSAVGLDIGTSGVRAAELSFGRGEATLQRFGQVALAPGAVRDGEVADEESVAAAIKKLWSDAKFSSKKVVVGVANQKVVVRQVDLPWLPADPRFDSPAKRSQNRAELNVLLSERLATRPTAAWVEAFNQAGVPCGPVYTMDEVFARALQALGK